MESKIDLGDDDDQRNTPVKNVRNERMNGEGLEASLFIQKHLTQHLLICSSTQI